VGLLDFFRMGKVLVSTAKAVGQQRSLGKDLAALPMAEFVRECVRNLNMSAGNWEGRARPPSPDAAPTAKQKQLPAELAEFYAECDGFEAVHGEFPALVLRLANLRLGSDYKPSLPDRIAQFWNENGNDSDKPGLLAILPPDDLVALATDSADCYIDPARLNLALPLCEPAANEFVAVLLFDAGERLPRGTVIDFENGAATRYPGFKAWLGSRASLFGSMALRSGAA
jgi:hypothetical protein